MLVYCCNKYAKIYDLTSLDLTGISTKEVPDLNSKKENELNVNETFLETTIIINKKGRYEVNCHG